MADSLAFALDLGTTSVKAGILGNHGTLTAVFSKPAPAVIRSGKRYESDPRTYLAVCDQLLAQCLAATSDRPPLGLSVQRSSFVIWEKESGQPVSPLISWQDSRATTVCQQLAIHRDFLANQTGLRLTPYFFAPKLAHVLGERPDWQTGLEKGVLLIGTLDCFLTWHWTSNNAYRTDLSMAARTLLVDHCTHNWSPDLAGIFNLSVEYLPVIGCSENINLPLVQGINLQASVADQSAALIATDPHRSAQVLVNLGTGGFACCFIDDTCSAAQLGGYQKTLVYQDSDSRTHTAIEGTMNSIGRALSAYSWDDFHLTDDKHLHTIYCIAEPSGLGAPFFREDIEMCFSQPIDHLSIRQVEQLVLEGVLFRLKQILDDFNRIRDIKSIHLAGGWSQLIALQQGIAYLCPTPVHLMEEKESSLLGAAQLASGRQHLRPVDSRLVTKTEDLSFLIGKFPRWRLWLDQQLSGTR